MRSGFRRLLESRAKDVTEATAGRTALVVAPHPDDETLGCGATILRKRQAGTEVTLLVVTDGRHSHRSATVSPDRLAALRAAELRAAASRLGIAADAVHWMGMEDGTVADAEDLLTERLVTLLAEVRPDELYVTCADEPHPDHAAAGRAARRAAARSPGVTLLEYAVWLWAAWPLQRGRRIGSLGRAVTRSLPGRTWIVRTDSFVEPKLYALAAHASQLGRPDGVEESEDWPSLPAPVLKEASGPLEVFFCTPASLR